MVVRTVTTARPRRAAPRARRERPRRSRASVVPSGRGAARPRRSPAAATACSASSAAPSGGGSRSASDERSSRSTWRRSRTARPRADSHRLERGRAAQQRLVVGEEDRLGGIDEPPARDRGGEQLHTGTRPPTAPRSGRAFTHDSSISASGSESQTMPPPTQRWMRPSATASVRIVSASSKSPSAAPRRARPSPRPRPTGSSAAIRSTAAIFGAPGHRAAGEGRGEDLAEPRVRPYRPSTVETRCVTPASSCWTMSSGQRTEPGSHTRARSFRSRSTIITCSAPSFSPSTSTRPAACP